MPHSIFIVEASETTLNSLENLFSKKGYTVTKAQTPQQALANKTLNNFSCIITSMEFTDVDGEAYIQEMILKASSTPIVVIASHMNVSKAVETLQKGAFYVVKKPILLKEVEKAVYEALSVKQKEENIKSLLDCVDSQMLFEIPGALGQIEGTIDLIAEETFNWKVLPHSDETSFRSALRSALHNAVLHGNKGNENKKVKIRFTLSAKGCHISIADEGDGFHPEDYINPNNIAASTTNGGLMKIYSYMDQVSFNVKGNQIRMAKFVK